MKKFVSLFMAVMMVLSLTACLKKVETTDINSNNDDVAVVKETSTTVTEEASEEGTQKETESGSEEEEQERSSDHYPLTLMDKYGEEVTIEKAPETIISMSPELTEIIYAYGKGDNLIGRSQYCNYPEAVNEVTDYGSLFNLNVESIVAAQPEVIFLSSMASEELVATLKDQGLTVLTFDKDGTIEGTYEYMTLMGKVLDADEEAAALVDSLRSRIDAVKEKVADLEKPTVYYVVWAGDDSDSTATGDTFIHDILTIAGGDNVAKDGTDWSYSVETLVEQDPYMMFCGDDHGNKSKIVGLEGYKELTAVKEDRLYEVDADIFNRQGPRIADAVEVLAGLIHPEAFK